MFSRILADITVLLHLGFVLYVVLGGLLTLKWRKAPYLHLPAALWGVIIELTGGVCPLTPLENRFRLQAGQDGYNNGFIEHYILPFIYPDELTRNDQIILGISALAINVAIYGFVCFQRRNHS
jgi:hypothetical protein